MVSNLTLIPALLLCFSAIGQKSIKPSIPCLPVGGCNDSNHSKYLLCTNQPYQMGTNGDYSFLFFKWDPCRTVWSVTHNGEGGKEAGFENGFYFVCLSLIYNDEKILESLALHIVGIIFTILTIQVPASAHVQKKYFLCSANDRYFQPLPHGFHWAPKWILVYLDSLFALTISIFHIGVKQFSYHFHFQTYLTQHKHCMSILFQKAHNFRWPSIFLY